MTGNNCVTHICLNEHIPTDMNIFKHDKVVLSPDQFIIAVSIYYKFTLQPNSLEKAKRKR